MMPNTDPDAVGFTGEIRAAAARTVLYYRQMKKIIQDATALGMAAKIPDDNDTIDDGANTDQRPVVTNAQIRDFMINEANAFVTDMEANNNAKLNKAIQIAGFSGTS
jgi:hypothetical protein